jgi:F0F1-type ATP synthase assembly protein I
MVLGFESTVSDLSAKRELNNGFGNSMSVAVELVVSPILMGLIGWRIDVRLGTTPLFALVLFLAALGYLMWKQFALYTARMDHQAQELLAPKFDRHRA